MNEFWAHGWPWEWVLGDLSGYRISLVTLLAWQPSQRRFSHSCLLSQNLKALLKLLSFPNPSSQPSNTNDTRGFPQPWWESWVFLQIRDPTVGMGKEKECLHLLKCQRFLFLDTKKFLLLKENSPIQRNIRKVKISHQAPNRNNYYFFHIWDHNVIESLTHTLSHQVQKASFLLCH